MTRRELSALQFWFDFTREWEGVLYELTHATRGLFGIPMAEALYVRGSGRKGKDTVCNAFKHFGEGLRPRHCMQQSLPDH